MNQSLQDKLIRLSIENLHRPNAKNKHFSFLIERNKVICMGVNDSTKTHPMALKFGYRFSAIHSEIDCIKRFPYPSKELKHFTMANVRIHLKTKEQLRSVPCSICRRILGDFELKEMWCTMGDSCAPNFIQLW